MGSSSIRVLRCVHPRYSWEVKWYEGGKRCRRYYTAEREARSFAAAKRQELAHAAPADGPISPEERQAVLRARALRIPLGEAVEAFHARREREGKSLLLPDLVARRLHEAQRENLSGRYAADLRRTLEAVAAFFQDRNAAAVTAAEAAAWIYSVPNAAPATIRKRRAMLSGLFEYGRRLGVLEINPAARVKPPRAAAAESVAVLSPEEARAYLMAVAVHAPTLLPMEAICLFAGLRRAEAERLDWSAVHLERGFIEVSAGIAKTKSRRLVDIEPALAQILEQLSRPAVGPVRPSNARRLRNRALKAAGWLGDKHGSGSAAPDARPWPENALRHSFVSYHLALYGDVARTELQAGHDRKVLFQHYRELVTQADAAEFWSGWLFVS